jgi:hypothetical protein
MSCTRFQALEPRHSKRAIKNKLRKDHNNLSLESSGMQYGVEEKLTDVSKMRTASIIRANESSTEEVIWES